MLPFKRCEKAGIYDLEHVFVSEADVKLTDDEEVILITDGSETEADEESGKPAAEMHTEGYVTFYDASMGLVTYLCGFAVRDKKVSSAGMKILYNCDLRSFISQVQRRRDLKVRVNIPMVCCYKGLKGKDMKAQAIMLNISAGGIYFVSKENLAVGQVFNFKMNKTKPVLDLECEILRVQMPGEGWDDTYKGYGCRFLKMAPFHEATLRGFVYHEDLVQQRRMVEG